MDSALIIKSIWVGSSLAAWSIKFHLSRFTVSPKSHQAFKHRREGKQTVAADWQSVRHLKQIGTSTVSFCGETHRFDADYTARELI